jgi:hypothetical protein
MQVQFLRTRFYVRQRTVSRVWLELLQVCSFGVSSVTTRASHFLPKIYRP